jgi:methionine synthase I (cobalamin-dependent)
VIHEQPALVNRLIREFLAARCTAAAPAGRRRLPQLNVMGGCGGTDHPHIEQIAAACAPLFQA